MRKEDGKPRPIEETGTSGEQADRFVAQEAGRTATIRRSVADQFLHSCGYDRPGAEGRSEPLDQISRLLQELDMLDESGGLLNSAEATLRSGGKSDIYFLGLNPGGKAGKDYSVIGNFPTLYESLVLSRLGVCGWDQDWSRKDARFSPGQSPLQKRFKHVAAFLGLAYSEILATNLVFVRSRRFKALEGVEAQLEACLPVHKMMVDLVQPKRLWVMGNLVSAGKALKLHTDVEWRAAKYSDWSIGHGTVDFCGRTMTLCHTPHLSFWDATAADKQELLSFSFGVRS